MEAKIQLLVHRRNCSHIDLKVLLGHAFLSPLDFIMPQPSLDCSYVNFPVMLNHFLLKSAFINCMCISSCSQLGHLFCNEWVSSQRRECFSFVCYCFLQHVRTQHLRPTLLISVRTWSLNRNMVFRTTFYLLVLSVILVFRPSILVFLF
jgi:hypothetical protein